MALTNVELYEALKASVGEDAARLIAEVVPAADELATKHDVLLTKHELTLGMGELRTEMGELRGEMHEGFATLRGEMHEGSATLRGEMQEGFATLRGEIHASSKETMRWMLTFFIPVWVGTWGTVLAILLKR